MREKNGFINKLRLVYEEYSKHVVTNQRFIASERQKWNELLQKNFSYIVKAKILKSFSLFFVFL